jgi:stage II sporulation protein D
MSKFIMRFIALFAALFLLGGQPSEFGQENSLFYGYLIEKPTIRVGLGINLDDIKVSSSNGMKVYEVNDGYHLIADDVDEFFLTGDFFASKKTTFYFIPSSRQSFLSYNGREYHGIFILKSSPKGVVLVNLLNLEKYLKSVVPSELSPYSFHELDAHKAQAVAARTYAIKNMGLKDNLGFDLFDTPKHQFYKGINAEHPLSSHAVDSTRGEVILYNGKVINALYTSSCGGKTEHVENVFQGPALPYLRSAECDFENQKEWTLSSNNTMLPVYINGRNISGEIATLISLDILEKAGDSADYMAEASQEEVLSWARNVRSQIGKPEVKLEFNGEQVDFPSFGDLIITAFDWEEDVENLLQESEKEYFLKDIPDLNDAEKDPLAYLIRNDIFPSQNEMLDLQRPLIRGEVIYYLYKALENFNTVYCFGEFKRVEQDKIFIQNDGKDKELKFSSETFLIKNQEGGSSFTAQAFLLEGEKIRWIEQDEAIRLLEFSYFPQINVLDRNLAYRSWQVRRSMQQMEQRINQYYPVGKLVDIVPLLHGESRRVIELSIKGEEGTVVVRGFKIQKVLGLRDTLFVIDREKNDNGNISYFVINGRGWGHGVGLCQIGAYGMAQAGANYKEILKKYYHGIEINKIY